MQSISSITLLISPSSNEEEIVTVKIYVDLTLVLAIIVLQTGFMTKSIPVNCSATSPDVDIRFANHQLQPRSTEKYH
jgi:hypothetical protein